MCVGRGGVGFEDQPGESKLLVAGNQIYIVSEPAQTHLIPILKWNTVYG